MPYRSPVRRYRPTTSEPRRINPHIRRAALARSRRQPGGGSALAVLTAVGVVLIAVLVATSAVTGAAGAVTVTELQADLPDPTQLEKLEFAQPTIVYDRTGKVELARFQQERRRVVAFRDIPKLVLDATTVVEDRTFWQNEGFDTAAIIAAVLENARGEGERGASTITMQLVRARLLPKKYLEPGADRYVRKAKELLQAQRVTAAFPGERGKERIITAYLNQIFYGHGAYGVAAAAEIYFGIRDLRKLTPAQAALLAGLPKSPSAYDLYRWAKPDARGRLVVPQDAEPLLRRNYILSGLRAGGRWTRLTDAQYRKAMTEPVVLAGERPLVYKAPHFVWAAKRQLDSILGDRQPVETGGYRVITSLDWRAQQLGEKYVSAFAILPNLSRRAMRAAIRREKLGRDESWITRLRGRDLHNGAMAAIDYRTGDVLAYVGSASYYREDLASREFNPKYDVAGVGFRQPGSAFKPIVYATGFETRRMTPATLLMDVTTPFTSRWTPRDADRRERGPVLVRKALQYSLNIPAIKAMGRIGPEAVAEYSERLGIQFPGGKRSMLMAGLAGGIGTVEVRLLDLVSAFGTFGNEGVRVPPRMVLRITGADGSTVYDSGKPERTRAISAEAAFQITDILEGNTNPAENLLWGPPLQIRNGPRGERRPAAMKTGTTNDTRDLSAYGYLAPPRDPDAAALAVGVWMGNSDHSPPRGDQATFASDSAARVWHSFLRDYTRRQPVATFGDPPRGLVRAATDKWSGGRLGPWTRGVINEWYIDGTEPGAARAVDPPGQLYRVACGTWMVDPVAAEPGFGRWDLAAADWAARARRGPGVTGRHGTATTYLPGERSWGGPIAGSCAPRRSNERRDRSGPRDEDREEEAAAGEETSERPGRPSRPRPPRRP